LLLVFWKRKKIQYGCLLRFVVIRKFNNKMLLHLNWQLSSKMLLHQNWQLKKNIITSKLGIKELGIDETNIQCNLELAHVIVFNPSDEICPKTNWEFRLIVVG
jgi:uncharacterized membrane protein